MINAESRNAACHQPPIALLRIYSVLGSTIHKILRGTVHKVLVEQTFDLGKPISATAYDLNQKSGSTGTEEDVLVESDF